MIGKNTLYKTLSFTFIAVVVTVTGLMAQSLPQGVIPYQGRLTDGDGAPLSGDYTFTFRISNVETGGEALWTETHFVTVTEGRFTVYLGSSQDLSVLGFDEPYYLSLQVDSDQEMAPRIPLTASPYSLSALWGTKGPDGETGDASGVFGGDQAYLGSLWVGDGVEEPVDGDTFSTLALLDSAPRITFNDTSSTSGSFASNDWEIRVNDEEVGGNEYFCVYDLTHGSQPFTIEAGAADNSLYISSDGDVGVGTNTPQADLHVSNAGSPEATILISGTGCTAEVGVTSTGAVVGSVSNHNVVIEVNGLPQMTITPSGTIQMADGGSYNGTWNAACSRELKDKISPLSPQKAAEIVQALEPVTYAYKKSPDDMRLGFIAEDVPEAVASPGRNNLRSLDILTAVTKVVQEQQKLIEANGKLLDNLNTRLSELESRR